ncbi:MAG: GNAT family N-acetyltransferase [Thermoanaerobaculia bacterium]
MHLRDATIHDLPAITALLKDANDTPYDLARVAREKCFEAGLSRSPRTIVAVEGDDPLGLITATRGAIRLIAVRRDRRREGIATRLLTALESPRLVAFGSPGNYFLPGVPKRDAGTLAFFESHAFAAESEAINLVIPLVHNERIPAEPPPETVRPRLEDRDEIVAFVRRAFGDAWAFEAALAWHNDPPTIALAHNDRGEPIGFAAWEANNRGLGFFGPMGVVEAARGSGLGRDLLLAALVDLRGRGHAEATISWAAIPEFYARAAGARPGLAMVRMVRF